ncbi:MAG: FAD-dependent oxidoreductase [Firmicutes bacterium]|nr:FAD-dependent oxidoreductase [Bacillota bacterium]
MKVVIVGGVAGGASAAARLRRLHEGAQIVMFERGEYISFANCGLPYYVGGIIPKRSSLLVQTPKAMHSRFNIDVRTLSEVVGVFPTTKEVEVKNLRSGETYRENYDYLVLAPGAAPFIPPIPGIDLANVFTIRNVPDSDMIKQYIEAEQPASAVVIGAGFIGIEMTEVLANEGVAVHLVEAGPQVMGGLDRDMAAIVHQYIRKKGIQLHLNSQAVAIEGPEKVAAVRLADGSSIEAQMVILGIGVRPETALAKGAGLALGSTGGILVDEYLRTSDAHIYAAGDAIQVKDFVTGRDTLVPMASPANRQGRTVADNISGRSIKYKGAQGTGIVRIMDLVIAVTGANARVLKGQNIDFQSCLIHPFPHATYYPGGTQMTLKILFAPLSGKVLGAQIVGYEGVDKRMDVLATAIRAGMTVFDLQELELAYAPPFSSAKDPVNMAAYAAGNIINGDVDGIEWGQVPELLAGGAFLLDVRTEREVESGNIQGAANIPLDELRERLAEVPRDKQILVSCQVGLRSYIAARILLQHGFTVKNIAGGFKTYQILRSDHLLDDHLLTKGA